MTEVFEEEIVLPWETDLAKATKDYYFRDSKLFLEYAGFADPKRMHHKSGPALALEITRAEINRAMREMIRQLQKDPQRAKLLVLGFIRQQNERIDSGQVSTEEIRCLLKPIRFAFEFNEILVPWTKYSKLIHKGKTTKRDREYRLEEIRLLLPIASLHLQVPILFMCSSGVRIGAFDYLRVGHVRPVYRINGQLTVTDVDALPFQDGVYTLPLGAEIVCGVMTIYSEEIGDEYDTLVTKEAYLKWKEYIESRVRSGELVTTDSPAILVRAGKKAWKSRSISNSINDLLWKVGLRIEKSKRHPVQMAHGFRKFYDNAAKDHIEEGYVEKLIGHDTGTKEAYDRHLPKRAIEQYLTAMPFLSIDESYRSEAHLTEKLAEAEGEKDKLVKDLRYDILRKGQEIDRLNAKMDRILNLLGKGAKVDPKLLDVSTSEIE